MRNPDTHLRLHLDDPRGRRRHRFMESADINAAFDALFDAMRTNIRRGLRTEGQLYGLEMDGCIPGQLLGTSWIPPASLGIGDPASLAEAERRQALFQRLFHEPRPDALFAYVCEPAPVRATAAVLYLEIVSRDARYAAEHCIEPGRGWHCRELVKTRHRRI
jgi:hypothetical protein